MFERKVHRYLANRVCETPRKLFEQTSKALKFRVFLRSDQKKSRFVGN